MAEQHSRRRLVILGAAGRDFHNFNVAYRGDPAVEVVAFTAAQIPGIAGRRYPAALAGALYPQGIPIVDESEFDALRICIDRGASDSFDPAARNSSSTPGVLVSIMRCQPEFSDGGNLNDCALTAALNSTSSARP